MIEMKRILCPVDFSDLSRHALDEAIAMGHLYGGCVTALHVFPLAIPADPFAGLPDFQPFRLTDENRAHVLRQLSAFATAEGAERTRIRVELRESSDIAAEILDAADQLKPNVIVMGTHGRSGFQRMMLGSVTEKVLHRAHGPVLTVPSKAPDVVPAGPVPFARILCGVDFSECSMAALDYARSLASQSAAQLDVVSVVQLIPMYDTTGAVPLYYPGMIDDVKSDITARLDEAVSSPLAGTAPNRFVTAGTPYREILRIAAERNSDLIVLGAYSHGGLDHLLFGSTTNGVVRQARCPVLTIRT